MTPVKGAEKGERLDRKSLSTLWNLKLRWQNILSRYGKTLHASLLQRSKALSSEKWKWKSFSHVGLFATPRVYSPWNSLGQNTGVGSLSLLWGILPTQGSNPGLLHCRRILYQLSHQGSPRILEWIAITSPGNLPIPGIEPGSPTLQADSLPAETVSYEDQYYIS